MSDNPGKNMKNGKHCPQSSIYFKIHMTFRKTDESVETKLNGFFKPASLRSETSTTSESSIDE
jgi:hypothetical protein